MNGADVMRRQVEAAHQWFEGTVADVTQAQADYLPAGTVHPIGELIAHIVQGEDGIVNGMLRGQPPI
ncbi:MAG: DinB family protein [Chloroflexi bacterium]|nr:DinB family protein [Chloroflexota bacterium]